MTCCQPDLWPLGRASASLNSVASILVPPRSIPPQIAVSDIEADMADHPTQVATLEWVVDVQL